jgi:hypothetical protein
LAHATQAEAFFVFLKQNKNKPPLEMIQIAKNGPLKVQMLFFFKDSIKSKV